MNGGVFARRVGVVLLCVLSLVVCVGLAWWQWRRFESGGTWQNLGYVLQWPLFGLFPAFVFWRLRKLRARPTERPGGAEPVERPAPQPAPPAEPDKPVLRQDVAEDAEPEDDPELAAYNRYLAKLNALDQQETR